MRFIVTNYSKNILIEINKAREKKTEKNALVSIGESSIPDYIL